MKELLGKSLKYKMKIIIMIILFFNNKLMKQNQLELHLVIILLIKKYNMVKPSLMLKVSYK